MFLNKFALLLSALHTAMHVWFFCAYSFLHVFTFSDPVPCDHWPRRPLALQRLPIPRLDAVGSDWLRRHLHHPLRQLLLPRLPEKTFLIPEDWQSRHQWQSSDQRPQQSRGGAGAGGGEQEEAKERESQEGVKVQG